MGYGLAGHVLNSNACGAIRFSKVIRCKLQIELKRSIQSDFLPE